MILRRLLMGMVRAYQLLISPMLGGSCRFEPTCSEYTALAVQKYGTMHGLWLGIKRLSRCRPPNGGIDYP